ncbi:MAG: VTT domain-containing protein [Clostridia bacterium]|nr:VTT domain-containing protein [Clostridia bacterium]
MRERKQAQRGWLIAVSVTVVIGLILLLALSGGNLALLKKIFTEELRNEEMRSQLKEFGWRGWILIGALSTIQVVCTFLPAEPVQVLAGFTFGFPVGLFLCMIGVLLGNTIIFMVHKTFADRLKSFFVKKINLDTDTIARSSKATFIVFVLYFLPAIPYGMICFLAAGMGMSYRRFICVTGLGALPSVCIGVALGYMTIVSDWIVTVLVFAALILLVSILYCFKKRLIEKLNRYAQKHRKAADGRVREVNAFVMAVLYYSVRAYLFFLGIRIQAVKKIKKIEYPAIVLCNHGSFIDFIYAAALIRKDKPHFVGARLYFYNKFLNRLLRTVGAFPKSMFAPDLENARNCFTVLRNHELLVMMPEARLSTTGRFEDIQENTFSFIQKAGANVYTIKISGDYLADPKWGKGFRRGSVVECELDSLFTADEISRMPYEELKKGIIKRLNYNEFDWLDSRPEIRYRSKRMAEGLENILTTCPICEGAHTLKTEKDSIYCEKCGLLTKIDDRYAFDAGFRFENLTQWYDWQKARLEKEILENEDYALSSSVELRLPGNGKGLTRFGGLGVCTLNREGLTYKGTKDNEEVELHFALKRVYRLLFGAGENFEIYNGAEILYFVPEEKRSAVDWYMASMILNDRTD